MVETYDAFIQHTRDPLTTENPAGRQLYDTLIAPASAFLPKDAHVIVVPDGPLYALNFETLPVPVLGRNAALLDRRRSAFGDTLARPAFPRERSAQPRVCHRCC